LHNHSGLLKNKNILSTMWLVA